MEKILASYFLQIFEIYTYVYILYIYIYVCILYIIVLILIYYTDLIYYYVHVWSCCKLVRQLQQEDEVSEMEKRSFGRLGEEWKEANSDSHVAEVAPQKDGWVSCIVFAYLLFIEC